MVCLHSTPKELILLKNENVSFYPLQLSDTSALLLSAQSSLSILAQKYLGKCEDTYFILQKKYYLCIYKDSFGAKILWDDCAHSEMGKNYFTCSFLIFSIVSDKLRKKFLSIIKSWHWFSSCLSEREIWAYFLKWTRTQLPKMFLFCPFFMYGTMKKYSSSMYKDGGSLFQKNNECWKRLTLTSTESKTKPINNCIYIGI